MWTDSGFLSQYSLKISTFSALPRGITSKFHSLAYQTHHGLTLPFSSYPLSSLTLRSCPVCSDQIALCLEYSFSPSSCSLPQTPTEPSMPSLNLLCNFPTLPQVEVGSSLHGTSSALWFCTLFYSSTKSVDTFTGFFIHLFPQCLACGRCLIIMLWKSLQVLFWQKGVNN